MLGQMPSARRDKRAGHCEQGVQRDHQKTVSVQCPCWSPCNHCLPPGAEGSLRSCIPFLAADLPASREAQRLHSCCPVRELLPT